MTALATIGGHPVQSMRLNLPLAGVWWADAVLDVDTPPKGSVSLSIGQYRLSGTIARAGVTSGSTTCRMVGGANGLSKTIGPQSYQNLSFSVPLKDITSASGEKLSPTCNTELLAKILPFFHRAQCGCGQALTQLVEVEGATWRVLANGLLWVGFESWPEVKPVAEIKSASPHLGRVLLDLQTPTVLPGHKMFGRKVSRVEYRLDEGEDLEASVLMGDN